MTSLEKVGIRYKFIFLCLLLFAVANVYLIHILTYESGNDFKKEDLNDVRNRYPRKPKSSIKPDSTTGATRATFKRITIVSKGVRSFFKRAVFSKTYHHNFSSLLISAKLPEDSNVWAVASKWVNKDQIVPDNGQLVYEVQDALRKKEIIQADVSTKGTQLKLALTLDGGQKVLFKPKWYERDTVLIGEVYGGKDRHNGEIAAFHLAHLLGLHRVPIVAGRKVNVETEILTVASPTLSRTFFKQDNNTCFYGVCAYCRPDDGVCASEQLLEGAVVLWLPNEFRLLKQRHPWQRSYSADLAKWQVYANYCSIVRRSKQFYDESELLDLVETSVFDFLIDNGDRHHYERFAGGGKVLLIDNGKSFGNPKVDHLDILAPLFQCCSIRERIVSVLSELQGGALSKWMRRLLQSEKDIEPALTDQHLQALDRRLKLALAAVVVCVQDHGLRKVLVPD